MGATDCMVSQSVMDRIRGVVAAPEPKTALALALRDDDFLHLCVSICNAMNV